MALKGRNAFLVIAIVFHLVYAWSIFDIYFVSPIVRGMRAYSVPGEEAPAKRLVLFVGDGLRADKAFQSFPDPSPSAGNSSDALKPRPLMPFLRSKVLSEGTFGVSHTRVPTESRPGHVAMIAGLYEDVSSVTTGWKLNPVNFDSVFNQSRHTWSWGSPDILPMFKEGAVPGRIDADTYEAEAEDFTMDAIKLDIWVFEKVKAMFKEAKTNAALDAALREDKIVFFLHLLGLDTTGHGFRPYSKEYLYNIQVVDQGVKEIVELMEDFYNDDGDTAYVFTADHGMSDWGSHGDGHPDNTRTPLITWGSGCAKPVKTKKGTIAKGHEDGFSLDWNLDNIQRNDVAQADIAALMAYLIGVNFPVNSVGELPLDYVSAGPKTKAKALLTNAREILEMYLVKEEQKEAITMNFKPYPSFEEPGKTVTERLNHIEKLIDEEAYELAISECKGLINVALEGLRYLQTYNWLFLRTLVTAGYIGWILFGVTSIIDLHVLKEPTQRKRSIASTIVFSSVLVALFSFLFAQESPLTYYGYSIFPVYFWEDVYSRRDAITKGGRLLFRNYSSNASKFFLVIQAVAFMAVLQALVWSYSNRLIYTICYALAVTWPFFYGPDFLRQNVIVAGTWVAATLGMSVFTVLPVVKVENLNLIQAGGVLMTIVGFSYLIWEDKILGMSVGHHSLARTIIGIQTGLIMLAMVVTQFSVTSLQAKQGLPIGTQIVGWLTTIASLIVPFLHTLDPVSHYLHRMLIIFLTFAPTFIILTISYEALFYIVFCITMLTWVQLEHLIYTHTSKASATVQAPETTKQPSKKSKKTTAEATNTKSPEKVESPYRSLTIADARPSLFTLYFLQSAFFSTGNIASVSSFSLDAVYRLIPVFDPFSQAALVIFKIFVPFIILSAAMGVLNKRLGFAPGALFMGLIVFGDWLTINFFWMVRDEGSWLEIGETISRFLIVSGLCVFAAGLEAASGWLVGGVDDGESLLLEKHSNGSAKHKEKAK